MSVMQGVEDAAPTVSLRIGSSTIAFEVSGEILETVEYYEDGSPDWSAAGVCDYRGSGGDEGYSFLRRALESAETNAKLAGYTILRVPLQT